MLFRSSPLLNQNTPCIKIDGILTDAFSPIESDEELVFFSTGKSAVNTKDISVKWPSKNKWLGLCNNLEYVRNANKSIVSGGKIIPLNFGGDIPPFSKVVLVSSNNLKKNIIDFSNLDYDLYIIFQCGTTNLQSDYLNDNTATSESVELFISAGEDCNDAVKYEPAKLRKNK